MTGPSGGAARSVLKQVGEEFIVRSGIYRLMRWWTSRRIVVLAYHNIVPRGVSAVGDRGLHLPVDVFEAQLRALSETHRIVPIDGLLSAGSESERPLAAITFDDAYAGAVTLGVERLVHLGLPGTIFISPGLLGGEVFWWDLLGARPGFGDRQRRRMLDDLQGDGRLVREEVGEDGVDSIPEYGRSATLAELGHAAGHAGISLGAHGWLHRNLNALPDSEIRSEMRESLRWLEETMPASMVPWITYPYGLATERVQKIAQDVGFAGGFLCGGGGFPPSREETDRFGLPRVNIPSSLSTAGFRIRSTGLNLL